MVPALQAGAPVGEGRASGPVQRPELCFLPARAQIEMGLQQPGQLPAPYLGILKPRPGFTVLAHKLALDPNAAAGRRLHSHAGAARAAYNWAVAYITAAWWQRRAEQSYGIREDQLTEWRSWSLPSLRKAFNEDKRANPRFAGWWEENSKEAYNTGLAGASAAFDNYAKSKSGRRKGRKMGIPRFKSKRKARLTCRFTTGTIRIEPDGHHVTLPRIGRVRLHENASRLRALVDAGHMRILSATARLDRGRWFVSFQVEEKHELVKVARPDAAVGIDLGIKTLAVLADSDGVLGEEPNPRHLDRAQKQLRRAGRTASRRRGPDRRTGQQASKRWEKGERGAEQDPPPGRKPPRGHPPQVDDPSRLRVRHNRRRRPQRRRNGPQPAPVPPYRGCRVRRDPTPAHLQDPPARHTTRRR